MRRFQCQECGCSKYANIEGWGEDEIGTFTEYICDECGEITRIYDE